MDVYLRIERRESGTPHGFEIGDMAFAGARGVATSQNPNRGMMIYLAIVQLLDGLSQFVRSQKRQYEFVGTDSSFIVVFRRRRAGFSLWYQRSLIAEVGARELLVGILRGVEEFLANPANQLPASDPVAHDLDFMRQEFRRLAESLGAVSLRS